ncbi:MAG: hypothetical protein PUB39_06350 [Eubacteriales bacterium]|nr:hypothetical protein [Eubacteriales bacterium]
MKRKKTFKDFLYENNDVILAVAILVVTGLIVVWRLGVIMHYPETIDINSSTQTEQQK